MTLRHDEHIGVVAGAALHLIDHIIGSAVRQRFTILRVAACRRSVGQGEADVGLAVLAPAFAAGRKRSEEHTSELQSLMRISYAVFCLKKKNTTTLSQ